MRVVSEVLNAAPLVGRDAELAALRETLRAGSGAVVAGEAGVGKTRLLRALAAAAAAEGMAVETARAGHPLLASPADAGAWLHDRHGDRPVVLLADDAHGLDRASASLLLQLALDGRAQVVAGVRAGETVPEPLTRLWRDAGALRLDLGPLPDEDMRTLLTLQLDGPVERRTRLWLLEVTRGNPLYLDELVRAARDGGALTCELGVWRRAGPLVPTLRLREVIEERLGQLSPAEQRTLALVALAEPLALGTLEELGGLPAARTLEERGLVVADDGGRSTIRTAHPLHAEIARTRLGAVEGRELRAALAAVLPRDEPGTRRLLAAWALQDDRRDDPALLAEGTAAALAQLDPERAVAFGRAAVAAGAGPEAAVSLAVALRATGGFGEAEALLAEHEAAVRGTSVAAGYLFNRAMGLQWGLRRQDDALALLQRAHAWAPGAEWRAVVRQIAATLMVTSGRLAEGLALAEPLLDLPGVSDTTRMRLTLTAGYALPLLGRPEEARDVLARARARCAPGFDVEWPVETIAVACAIASAEGWDEAERDLGAVHEEALAARAYERATVTEISLVRLANLRGASAHARALSTEAVERFSLMDPREHVVTCLAELAIAAVGEGDVVAARDALVRCEALRRTWPTSRASVHRTALATAAVLAAEGRPVAAQRAALDAADAAGEALLWEAEALYEHVRLGGRPAVVRSRLDRLAERAPRTIVARWARHVRAWGDGAALERVAGDWERTGAMGLAQEALEHAVAAYTARGDGAAAERARARSAQLAALRGVAAADERAAHALAVLRPREREVARLVALRLSNAEIAERLSLSVRTVESHVYRATARLGLRTRSELAAAVHTAVQ